MSDDGRTPSDLQHDNHRADGGRPSPPVSQAAQTPSGGRQIAQHQPSLAVAGQIANRIAGQDLFQRYLSEKSTNTIKRHARDLELFAEYLIEAQISLDNGADFQTNPDAWRGITWGLVEGFVQWLLQEGYAISSVKPEGKKRRVVVSRRSTKKPKPTLLDDATATTLKQLRNASPQA